MVDRGGESKFNKKQKSEKRSQMKNKYGKNYTSQTGGAPRSPALKLVAVIITSTSSFFLEEGPAKVTVTLLLFCIHLNAIV